MNIGERIRRIRELKGWKQDAVAIAMKTTQQAFSCLEAQPLPRMETINRFCAAVEIEPIYLLSDIPISEESLEKYGKLKYSELVTELNYLRLKAAI